MIKKFQLRIKTWWDIWVFVVGFPIGLVFLLFFWYYLIGLSENQLWIIVVSIVCLYSAIILIVSTIIAISENNIFVSSFILLLIGVTIGILGYFYSQQSLKLDTDKLVNDFYANVSTELVSIVITVLAIETLRDRIHWRNYQREKINQEPTPGMAPTQTVVESTPTNTLPLNSQTSAYNRKTGFFLMVLIFTAFGVLLQQYLKIKLRSNKK